MQSQTLLSDDQEIRIPARNAALAGTLSVPAGASGVVLFAHGSGSSRHSSRNVFVARTLQRAGIGTLLFDLLTRDEESVDARTAQHRFDIPLLAERLVDATRWIEGRAEVRTAAVGYFGASTGSAAALVAAAKLVNRISAVVSRGGRPDLADAMLPDVTAATLLIVGGADHGVIELNEHAFERLRGEKRLTIVPNATHLFEEPGALEQVSTLAADWFGRYLRSTK